jgi:hypothetical protein
MAQPLTLAAYSGEDVDVMIVPAGFGPISVKAKGSGDFVTIARGDAAQWKTTARYGHQVTVRAAERVRSITVVIQGTAAENTLLQRVRRAQDATGQPVYCAVTVIDRVGRRTLWHMPSGVLGTYPDDNLGEESGDLSWGFGGVVEDAEV